MSNTYDPYYKEEKVTAIVGQKIIIQNEKGEILLLKRSKKSTRAGGWDFAGGGLGKGENPLEGAKREVKEETGLDIETIKPIDITSFINDENDFVIIIAYLASTQLNEVVLSWEHDDYKWERKEKILEEELPDLLKLFLKKLK